MSLTGKGNKIRTYTVSNATFGDEDEHSTGTEIRSGENEVRCYNFANFLKFFN